MGREDKTVTVKGWKLDEIAMLWLVAVFLQFSIDFVR